MVLAYHAIWSTYGFWLPNEQRGSWSTEVWAQHLKRFGPATKTTERRSLAYEPFDRALRDEMRAALKYPAVEFNLAQIRAIAGGFAKVVESFKMSVFACAIMPDHVHLVIGRHESMIEYLVGILKRAGTRQMNEGHLHPLSAHKLDNERVPSPWTDGGWVRYLNSHAEIVDAVDYVRKNPLRIGWSEQKWDFIVQFQSDV